MLLILLTLGCTGSAPEVDSWPARDHVADGALRDAEGRALLLRGVNLSNRAKDPSTGFLGWEGPEDLHTLASWGMNSVRLLTFWEAVEPEPGVFDTDYLDALDERIAWADAAHLRVVVDMHQDLFGRGFGHAGAPTWACDQALYDAYEPVQPWSLNYFSTEITECFDRLWADEDLQEHLIEAWVEVALRTADEPAVLGYDLFNEPFWGSAEVDAFEAGPLQRFYERAAARIHEVAPEKLIFVEPTNATQLGLTPGFGPFSAEEVVLAPHFYQASVHEGRPYDGDDHLIREALEVYDEAAHDLDLPWWMGEMGGPTEVQGYPDYLTDVESTLAEHGAGWAYWSMDCQSQGFALLDDDCSPKEEVLAVLTHPHAVAVAGDAVEEHWDPRHRRLEVRARARAGVEAPTLLWVGEAPVEEVVVEPAGSWTQQGDTVEARAEAEAGEPVRFLLSLR